MIGMVYTTGSMDYETAPSYNLTVEAIDEKQNLQSTTSVNINVKDQDDPPRFDKNSYQLVVDEDVPIGTTVLTKDERGFIILDDDDNGGNDFECSIYNPQSFEVLEFFDINRVGVDCRLVTKLVLETSVKSAFDFEVRATEKMDRTMVATAKVGYALLRYIYISLSTNKQQLKKYFISLQLRIRRYWLFKLPSQKLMFNRLTAQILA